MNAPRSWLRAALFPAIQTYRHLRRRAHRWLAPAPAVDPLKRAILSADPMERRESPSESILGAALPLGAAAVAVAGAYAVVLATRDDAAANATAAGGTAAAAVPLDPAAVFVHAPVAAGDEAPAAGSALAAVGSGADAGSDESAADEELAVSALADLDADGSGGGGTAGGGGGLADDLGAGGAGGGAAGGGSGIHFPDPPFSPPAANGDGSGGPGSGFGSGGGGGAALASDQGGGSANGGGFYPAGAPAGNAPGQSGGAPGGGSGGAAGSAGGAAGANGAQAGVPGAASAAGANPRGANSGGTGGAALALGPTSGGQNATFTTVDGETVPDGAAPFQPPVARDMGGVPGYFEQNVGQMDRVVDFVARGNGYTLFLTADAVTVAGYVPGEPDEGPTTDLVRLRLVGANPDAEARGSGTMDLKVAYLHGESQDDWITEVPTVARVDYTGIYAGIDATYYADPERGLAFDFTVRPGADASAIRLAVDGEAHLSVTDEGLLAVETRDGILTLSAPVAFQDGADGERSSVAACFVQHDDGIGIELGDHDADRAVVIDPAIVYGSFLGGSADDGVYAVASDSAGNSYLAGYTFSTDLPGQWTGSAASATSDVMVAKLSPDGKRLLYVAYIGGSGNDTGYGIAVNHGGEAYVVGDTASTNFPVTTGALDTTGGGADGFVMKLAPDGQSLSYATYVSPTASTNTARGVALAGQEAVVVGATTAALGYSTPQNIGPGSPGAYALRLNSTGTTAVFNTTLRGIAATGSDAAGVALDLSGNVYVTGVTTSASWLGTFGVFGTAGGAYAVKLNSTGTTASYTAGIASSSAGATAGKGVAVDFSGNAFVVGYIDPTFGTLATTTGAFQTTAGGGIDGFAMKLSTSGTVSYASYLGGSGTDRMHAVAVDAAGFAWVAG